MVHNTTSMARLVNQGMKEWGIALYGRGRTIEEAMQDVASGYRFPQILYMSCGYKRKMDVEGLPTFSVPCPCGNPSHWIVKYELVRQPLLRRLLSKIRGLRHCS